MLRLKQSHDAPQLAGHGHHPDDIFMRIAHGTEVRVSTEPVPVKLGVWVSNTKQRRDKLTQDQLDALRELGMKWA
ncbi:Helicase associated domain protein [Streptomyces chartreusis NRRL 3882]|uniref:Helicase associated domain protein n=1 Tax=Streptomyces chartreusis NRRL 3882 TaxID=1079985 RepID=A0A2N9AZT5_STRCX|nr:Helicase associated domain protein [Streptomyces chartreusis NRRL 3882]